VAIYDLYSKRQKRLRGEGLDVLVYDSIPRPLRIQILAILDDALGRRSSEVWDKLHNTLTREYGVVLLHSGDTRFRRVRGFFIEAAETEQALDFIELAFRAVDIRARDSGFRKTSEPEITPDEAITELNGRFREHGVGYQYESDEIIRLDSTFLHSEAVKPALQLLNDPLYAGANTEFLSAHEHYRHGRNEEALTECLKALESVVKVICEKRSWDCKEKDTAKRLLEIVFQNKLVPEYLQSEFTALRTSLESGVPTVRNRQSGHGRGTKPRDVPGYLVSYLLHLTASDILFLVNAEKATK
jgi:hypothetical protein